MIDENHVLVADQVVVRFSVASNLKRNEIVPVRRVSFSLNKGEVLAIVGESGSGKTTIGRALVRLLEPNDGTIMLAGKDITHVKGRSLHEQRKNIQMIFQDPYGSLNPVHTIAQHLAFPIKKFQKIKKAALEEAIEDALLLVGLTPVSEMKNKFPHELSGGQRQRVAIARALAVRPKVVVADEPISMLDVSIRAEILNLLKDLQKRLGISFVYITHDLASARYFGDRIAVMYGGQIMELAPSDHLIHQPHHPYSKLLLAATPGMKYMEKLPETSNRAPNLLSTRKGCPFAERCPAVLDICSEQEPLLRSLDPIHHVACHLYP